MKHMKRNAGRSAAGFALASFALAGMLLASGAAVADKPSADPMVCSVIQPNGIPGPATTTLGVVPDYCAPWQSGDAGQECVVNLGYDFGLKLDGWGSGNRDDSGACDGQGSCELAPEFNNAITITNNDGTYFDWSSSPFALGAVVVKGGQNANVFTYAPPASADTDLYAPLNVNNSGPYDVSHGSFCWNMGDNDQCYQDETAWAVGNDYNANGKGNWAMYVPYTLGETKTVVLRADGGDGVGIDAGTATFEPSGTEVKITINLDNSFIFYYDLNDDEEDNNLKVQDYDTAPKGNVKTGRFASKTFIPVGSTTGSILVAANNYYGVHLDLAYLVPCE
jgi:hypothetical protein